MKGMKILVVRTDVLIAENCKPLSQHLRVGTKVRTESKRCKCFTQQSAIALKSDADICDNLQKSEDPSACTKRTLSMASFKVLMVTSGPSCGIAMQCPVIRSELKPPTLITTAYTRNRANRHFSTNDSCGRFNLLGLPKSTPAAMAVRGTLFGSAVLHVEHRNTCGAEIGSDVFTNSGWR